MQTETCSQVYVKINVLVSDGFMTDCFGWSCRYNYISILIFYSSIILIIYLILEINSVSKQNISVSHSQHGIFARNLQFVRTMQARDSKLRPSSLYYAARCHICKLCMYYEKLHSNLGGLVYHLLLFVYMRPAKQPTVTGVTPYHKQAGDPSCRLK